MRLNIIYIYISSFQCLHYFLKEARRKRGRLLSRLLSVRITQFTLSSFFFLIPCSQQVSARHASLYGKSNSVQFKSLSSSVLPLNTEITSS